MIDIMMCSGSLGDRGAGRPYRKVTMRHARCCVLSAFTCNYRYCKCDREVLGMESYLPQTKMELT